MLVHLTATVLGVMYGGMIWNKLREGCLHVRRNSKARAGGIGDVNGVGFHGYAWLPESSNRVQHWPEPKQA